MARKRNPFPKRTSREKDPVAPDTPLYRMLELAATEIAREMEDQAPGGGDHQQPYRTLGCNAGRDNSQDNPLSP
jgi:hypothetical protein